jgi:DNA repair protein RadC
VADPKLIIAVALKSAATGIILTNNHPSGNLQPSEADIEITKKIQSALSYWITSLWFLRKHT